MHITIAGLDKRDSIFYEAGNDLLDMGVCSIHFPLCYCASVIHATRKFFIYYLLEMTISLILTSDLLKVSLVTLEIVYI